MAPTWLRMSRISYYLHLYRYSPNMLYFVGNDNTPNMFSLLSKMVDAMFDDYFPT